MSVRGDFGVVVRVFWRDPQIRESGEDARTLALYVLTGPVGAIEGFYPLERALMLSHLGWPEKRLAAALSNLSWFATYDDAAQAVFVHKTLKFQAPKGISQIRGALKALDRVQGAPGLFWAYLNTADKYAPEFAAAIRERYGIKPGQVAPDLAQAEGSGGGPVGGPREGLGDGISELAPQTRRDTDTDTDTDRHEPKTTGKVREEVSRLSNLLAVLIRQRDPKARVSPDAKPWTDAIRLLIDTDGRTPAEVEHVIRWCQRDDFWKKTVLSAPTLRKQFDRLYAKAGKPKGTADDFFKRNGIDGGPAQSTPTPNPEDA